MTTPQLTDEQIDAVCAPGRAERWKGDGRQYDRDTARLIERAILAAGPGDAVDIRRYVILQKHGEVPRRIGPCQDKKAVESTLREAYTAYPDCICIVINLPGESYPQHGREWLDMYGDKRKPRLTVARSAPLEQQAAPPALSRDAVEKAISRVANKMRGTPQAHMAANVIAELRAELAAQGQDAAPAERSKSCLWSHADDDTDLWETSCGNAFSIIDGTPEENEFRHCCYCGGVLETARAKE